MGRPYSVDPAAVAPHLHRLVNNGATATGIAEAAHASTATVQKILAGTQETIHATTAARLLAVADAADDYYVRVDATAATRRVRALMAIAHPVADIRTACEPPIDRTTMTQLINGTLPRIRARTDNAIAEAYEHLSMTVGTSALSRNRALRQGWAPPAAWDGIDMSDPNAFPDFTGHCGTTKGYQAHRTTGIPRCQPCKNAEAAASAERKARQVAAAQMELAA